MPQHTAWLRAVLGPELPAQLWRQRQPIGEHGRHPAGVVRKSAARRPEIRRKPTKSGQNIAGPRRKKKEKDEHAVPQKRENVSDEKNACFGTLLASFAPESLRKTVIIKPVK